MVSTKARVWLAASAFISILSVAGVLELLHSYKVAVETASERSDLPGYLVSEWIVESFQNVEMVLRDSLAGFDGSNLSYAEWSLQDREVINRGLVRRAALHGPMVFLGIFDRDCVIQFGSSGSIIGDSSADLGRPIDDVMLERFVVSD